MNSIQFNCISNAESSRVATARQPASKIRVSRYGNMRNRPRALAAGLHIAVIKQGAQGEMETALWPNPVVHPRHSADSTKCCAARRKPDTSVRPWRAIQCKCTQSWRAVQLQSMCPLMTHTSISFLGRRRPLARSGQAHVPGSTQKYSTNNCIVLHGGGGLWLVVAC